MTQTEEEVVSTEEATETEATEEETTTELSQDEIDYKAIVEAERKRAQDAVDALEITRTKARERIEKKQSKEDDNDDDGDKPLTKSELLAILREDKEERTREKTESAAREVMSKLTQNKDEAEAALIYLRDRVKPSGNLEEDALFALGGLNARRHFAQTDELKRALRSKDTARKNTASTQHDAAAPAEPQLTSRDATAIKAAGFAWDGKSWAKPIGKDRILRKSKDLKKTWVDKK